MESSTAPAAGWFPDPGDPSTERWWSGHEWTEHTRRPLGAEVPEAFTPHVATLVAERPAAEPEPFVFAMTPTAETASAAETTAAEPVAAIQPEASPAVELGLAQPAERSWFTTDEPLSPEVSTLLTGAPLTPPWLTPAPELADPAPLAAAPEPAAPEPIAPGFIASAPAETATATPQPVFALTPSFAGTAPSTPEPMLTNAATLAPVPALTTPAPVAVPTAPEFVAPAVVAPAASALAPAPDAAEGFVLPGAPVGPVTAADLEPRVGRHADAMPEPAPVPAPALPAVRPVGFTASADPEVANRYRSVIHAADQEALAAPAAAPAHGNMPSSTMMSARPTSLPPGYAAYPASNRAADAALRSGIVALIGIVVGVAIRMIGLTSGVIAFAPGILSLGSWVSGVVAIVTGIVGIVVARRARVGFGKALGGLLIGSFVSIVIPVGFVVLALMFASALGLLSA